MAMFLRQLFIRLTVVGLALAGAVFLPAGHASASTADRYVAGAGATWDDLGDESTLCSGCAFAHSNYTGLWQMILAVDYGIDANGNYTDFPWNHIDCDFGPETRTYTENWQRYNGLPVTGRLDAATRAAVADRLTDDNQSDGAGGDYIYYPANSDNTISIHRRGGSVSAPYRWDVQGIANVNDWHGAAYDYVNFSTCNN
jgi:peptidoglycan hydrolase-like protein with peptidoglycan-binding domain